MIYTQQDKLFLTEAIKLSQESFNEGAFPAGAIIVKNNEIIIQTTSAKFSKNVYHAEYKSIGLALEILDSKLTDCILYTSMQPCLMCLSKSYWSGIRKIFYAIDKKSVPNDICYESNLNNLEIANNFNENIELLQIEELENDALLIVNKWLDKYYSKDN